MINQTRKGALPLIKEVNYEWLTRCGWEVSLSHFIFFSMGELEKRAIGNTTKKESLEY